MMVEQDAAPSNQEATIVGRVEGLDAEAGLHGWAYDSADKSALVEVELWAGATLIAVTEANRFRSDLGSESDPELNPGFTFGAASLKTAALNLAVDPGARLVVRVRGGDVLPGLRTATFAGLNELFEEQGAPPADTSNLDLRGALAALTLEARLLRKRPLRPLSDATRGFVERVALLDRSTLAVSGWIHRDMDLEQAAVVLDGEKYDAGFSLAAYDRSDLPEHAHAFVGVLQTAWRPRPRGSEPFIFFGQHGQHHLRSTAGLKLQALPELTAMMDRAPSIGAHTRVLELRQMLRANEGWSPRPDNGAGLGVTLSIDKAMLLPGFGAVLDGWALTGPRRVVGMALRIGAAVLDLDPGSLRRRSRPDLVKAFPTLRDGAATAGFTGLFIGPLHQGDLLDPLFRLQFADGTAVAVSLNPATFQQIDANFDADLLKPISPSLAMEPRFPKFAAARSALLKRTVAASAHAVLRAPAERIVVMALPASDHELTLALEGIGRNIGRLPLGATLALVGQPNQNRDRILPWLEEIRARAPAGVGVSFTLIENVHLGLYACETLVRAHKASVFGFVGACTWLTDAGWEALGARLSQVMETGEAVAPEFLPVTQSLHNPGPSMADAELFVWTTAALRRWLLTAPVSFDEAARDRGLPQGALAAGTTRAGVRLRPPAMSAYKAGLDRALLFNAVSAA